MLLTDFTMNTNLLDVSQERTGCTGGVSALSGHSVDILIFNPPYVPTTNEEVVSHYTDVSHGSSNLISAAWAGGIDGRVVIDKFLPLIPVS